MKKYKKSETKINSIINKNTVDALHSIIPCDSIVEELLTNSGGLMSPRGVAIKSKPICTTIIICMA